MGAPDRFSRNLSRDQITGAQSWRPSPLGSAQTTSSAQALELEARIVAREHAAQERGRAIGFAEAAQITQAKNDRHGAQVAQVLAELRGRFAELEGAAADRVLDLAIAIAAQVLRREAARPEALVAATREAVAAVIDHHAHPRVHVHPQSLDLLREAFAADGTLAGCRFVADATLETGGCRVEVPSGEIDATLATRWRRVLESLGMPAAVLPPLQAAEPASDPSP
jgi:flagellar assembly protein FliH